MFKEEDEIFVFGLQNYTQFLLMVFYDKTTTENYSVCISSYRSKYLYKLTRTTQENIFDQRDIFKMNKS